MDLMVLVEDQKWSVQDDVLIRNESGQCPICAIVDVLSNGTTSYGVLAYTAWRSYIGEEPSPYEYEQLDEIIGASDNPHYNLRKELEEVLING